MIRKYKNSDLDAVIKIWLETNINAHSFIPKEYWENNYNAVKEMLPQADIYVYVNKQTASIEGFIGLQDNYIAGIFVQGSSQSKGIGKKLLDYIKRFKSSLRLNVYQKNQRAVHFYQREQFVIASESIDETNRENEFIMMWNR